MITRSKEYLKDEHFLPLLKGCLEEHLMNVQGMNALHDLYLGKGDITRRMRPEGLPNNRLSHGYARYIVLVASAYLAGGGVRYTCDEPSAGFEKLMDMYRAANTDAADMEIARHASLYGRGVELLYVENGQVRTAVLDPRTAFVVYDATTGRKPLFGMYFACMQHPSGALKGYRAHVFTHREEWVFEGAQLDKVFKNAPVSRQPHYFGQVPMVEYLNGDEEESDLSAVKSLIDAYDVLQSDRVNDREQQVDALLLLYGAQLAVDEKGRTPAQQLRQDKLLYLPDRDAGAEYLCPSGAGADAETLRLALERDIHKFAMVPDLSDEHFSGDLSGVAIKYKLLGLEQLTRMKERHFRESLRQRMRLFAKCLSVKDGENVDVNKVKMTFRRTLPTDLSDTAQAVKTLDGMVDRDVLQSQLPFGD